MGKKYTRAEIEQEMLRPTLSQGLVYFLLGRRVTEALEASRDLCRVMSGHRVARYSTAKYLAIRSRIDAGELVLTLPVPRREKQGAKNA